MTEAEAVAEEIHQSLNPSTTNPETTNGSSKPDEKVKRTAKDYKKLYDYLYKKYTEKNEQLNFQTELEGKLVDLIKYYEMRNHSILDLIHFAEEQDAKNIGYAMTSELTKRQENARVMKILTAKPELKPIIVPMMKEDPEDWNVRPELNQSLFLLENLANTTVYSPAALESLFDDVNRNINYHHSIVPNSNYVDLDKVEGISKLDYSVGGKGKGVKRKIKSADKPSQEGPSSNKVIKEDVEDEEKENEEYDGVEDETAGDYTESAIEEGDEQDSKRVKLEPEAEADSNENSITLDETETAVED